MTTPPFLKSGDTIAIVAPARKVTPLEIQPAVSTFESWGLHVLIPDNLFASDNQYAGTDSQRTSDLQSLLDNDDVKAICCARGGYGTVRCIDNLNFDKFNDSPKWIIGYSDITVLHSHIAKNSGVETIHATMPINFSTHDSESNASIEALRKCLFGTAPQYTVPGSPFNRPGTAHGELIGGNLSILYSLTATDSDIDTTGKVLFIEDIDEYLYHIDRMMMNLKRNHKLDDLAGMVVGGFTGMRDNEIPFGKTPEEIIYEKVKDYKYPVIFGFPAGHQPLNLPLIMGREVSITVDGQASLSFMEPMPVKGLKRFKNLLKPAAFVLIGFIALYLLYSLLLGRL
ncbi:MAG: LD-carboxypeptidase [Lentimicrobiaceae bacterium]